MQRVDDDVEEEDDDDDDDHDDHGVVDDNDSDVDDEGDEEESGNVENVYWFLLFGNRCKWIPSVFLNLYLLLATLPVLQRRALEPQTPGAVGDCWHACCTQRSNPRWFVAARKKP